MTWELTQAHDKTPPEIYQLALSKRLVPANMDDAIGTFRALAQQLIYEIHADGELVATVFVHSIVPGERAQIDFVPNTQFFKDQSFKEPLKHTLGELFMQLFHGYQVHRITAQVPESRGRTKKALRALGFKVEGKMIEAVHYDGRPREDVYVMGLLRSYLED